MPLRGFMNYLQQRYELQKRLGKVTGRQTWLATDLKTQQLVVIKLLTFGAEFVWDDLKLFEREAETLKSLEHPAIPRYLDYFEYELAGGQGFALVQTYIDANSLAEHLQAGRSFGEIEVRQIAKDLLEILQYLHNRCPSVIHRDIKPSNILMDDHTGNHPGQIYLVDFGAVQSTKREGGTITIVGTYGYMPPEQFGGRAMPASDLYSLGATLIYLVTGLHPADLLQDDLHIQFKPVVNLAPELTDWLKQLTEPSLKKRIGSAEAALMKLENPTKPQQSPLVSQRPSRSKLQLQVETHHFKLTIPPHWEQLNYFIPITLTILGLIAFPLWWSVSSSWLLLYYASWFFDIFLAFIAYETAVPDLGEIQFQINEVRVSCKGKFLGFTFSLTPTIPKSEIYRITYTPRYAQSNPTEKNIIGEPALILWAGTEKFRLHRFIKNDSELEWIANELSVWLGIELVIEKPSTRRQ
jgi:serine/threonine protein kinase